MPATSATSAMPETNQTLKRIRYHAYVRRSEPGEEDANLSLETQGRDLREWVERRGDGDLLKVYRDPGGKSQNDKRPWLLLALEDARKREYDVLLVWKYNRLSRAGVVRQANIISQFEDQYGVQVEALHDPMPKEREERELLRAVQAYTDKKQFDAILQHTMSARVTRTKQGKLPGAPFNLFGYLHQDAGPRRNQNKVRYVADWESIDADPEHAPARIVARIFHLAASGLKVRQIGIRLEREGVPTPFMVLAVRGRLPRNRTASPVWGTGTLSRILDNPAYYGDYVAWRTERRIEQETDPDTGDVRVVVRQVKRAATDPQRMLLVSPEGEPPVVEPLVTKELWLAAHTALKAGKDDNPRHAKDPEAALLARGVATCGYCGKHMSTKYHQANKHYRYVCGASNQHSPVVRATCAGGYFSWAAPLTDTLVWQWLIRQFEQPEIMRTQIAEWKKRRGEGRAVEVDMLATSFRNLKRYEERADSSRLAAVEAQHPATRAKFIHDADEAEQRADEERKEVERLQAVLAQQEGQEAQAETFLDLGKRALERLRAMNFETKRAVLKGFAVEVQMRRRGEENELVVSWLPDPEHRVWARVLPDGAETSGPVAFSSHTTRGSAW